MTLPHHHRPSEPAPGGTATTASALIETVLVEARITALAPNRLVLVGNGQRLRIDVTGVHRQRVTDLRLVLPLGAATTSDEALQRRLGRWAAHGTVLHVQEVVASSERFERVLHLSDCLGEQATVANGETQPR